MNKEMVKNVPILSVGGDKYDLAKFILASMVVCIHANFFPLFFKPILKIAVPLFFIISSFFFFSKQSNNAIENKERLFRFVKRNMILYFFWTIVLIVPIIIYRHYLSYGVISGILCFIRSFFFGSTFIASWFITALVFAVIVVFCLSKILSTKVQLLLFILPFLFCCMTSNYQGLSNMIPGWEGFYKDYQMLFGDPHNNLVVAFFWVALGKWFSENSFLLNNVTLSVSIILGLIMLFIENYLVMKYHFRLGADDCYVSLLLLSPMLFQGLRQSKDIHLKKPLVLRKCSTMIFCTHGTIIWCLGAFFHRLNMFPSNIEIFGMTVVVLCIGCPFILLLENKMPILKYAY